MIVVRAMNVTGCRTTSACSCASAVCTESSCSFCAPSCAFWLWICAFCASISAFCAASSVFICEMVAATVCATVSAMARGASSHAFCNWPTSISCSAIFRMMSAKASVTLS